MDHADPLSSVADILPDSRLSTLKGSIYGVVGNMPAMNWRPVFCANCGKFYGRVPEENCSFACWLCDPCAEKWGTQYGLAYMPDEVFHAKLKNEMIEKYGRVLTDAELMMMAESDSTLSKLVRERK